MCDFTENMIIVSGPSGAGKDTIVRRLLSLDPTLSLSVSATTRTPRNDEKDGISYYFLSKSEFEKRIDAGDFIEHTSYGNNLYGTLKSDVADRIKKGKTVILVIEVSGAKNVRHMYPGILSIFIMPPSPEILDHRLRARKTDSEDAIVTRLDIAKKEMLCVGEYQYMVINDDLDEAVKKVYSIIDKHRKGR